MHNNDIYAYKYDTHVNIYLSKSGRGLLLERDLY